MDLAPFYEKYGKEKVDGAVKYLTYKKAPPPLPKEESDEFPTLYVFRHGQTKDNADMLFSGWRDVGLTKKGEKQAEMLQDQLKNKKIDMLYTSDLIRAIKTMEIAIIKNESAKNLKIHKDPRIKERSYGDWQGTSKLEKHLEGPEALMNIRRGYDTAPPNGESLKMTVERVKEFLDELLPKMKKENINVAISCHGNSIRGIRQYFESLSEEETAALETPLGKDYAAYVIK